MSSADSKDNSDTRPDDSSAADAVEEPTHEDSVDVSEAADAVDEADAPVSGSNPELSVNAEKRAARQARKADSGNVSLSIPVRRIKQVLVGLVVAAVIAVIAVGGWQLYQKNQELAAFDDSKAAASNFVVTYFQAMSGPNADAASLRNAVGPLSTGEFKKRLGSDAVVSTQFMKENKVENIKTTVTSSMVESFDADSSTVVLGVDVSGTSAVSSTGGKNAILLQLSMEKVDGDWLVSAIEAGPGVTVGAQQGAQTPQAPAPAENPAPAPAPGG
ncbi:hypothetical protein [Gordonia neofelifaecis]|uniref:Mce-associated membrane protein n=1 Tax=Gordonia neofelifaecis NRRL B-59395 TaxID=644548 RepID=F1YHQ3_9ACTN|nr:hypothetical protein [Gordonia neofelifaecis]EGD55891.1 hypothetical protein SCNU_06605 [Gordonia neofelifaecis NRRL B-59395]